MSQMCLRSKQNIARAIKLQMDHKLRPRWHKIAGTTTIVCNLVHEHSGEWMHRGTGKNPEDSFHAAMQAFNAAPKAAQAESLSLENESLRQQLRDLEQKLEEPAYAADQKEPGDDQVTPDADGATEYLTTNTEA